MNSRTSPPTASEYAVTAAESPPFLPLIIFSLIFHVLILVVVPLITHLIWNPTQFVRPQTFSLVSMPKSLMQPQQTFKNPEKAAAKPKTQTKKATPKPADKKAAPRSKKQEETESLDELSELLGGISAPISEISSASNFKYQWYYNNIMSKVERFWRPPAGLSDKKDIYVTVSFTIFANGTISETVISHSSGNSSLDQLAGRAIKLAAPFGKFPVGYTENQLEIDYILRPEAQ